MSTFFSEKRKTMQNTIVEKFPSTKSLNNNDIFIWLMSQEDSKTIQTFANYLRKAFTKRNKNNYTIIRKCIVYIVFLFKYYISFVALTCFNCIQYLVSNFFFITFCSCSWYFSCCSLIISIGLGTTSAYISVL